MKSGLMQATAVAALSVAAATLALSAGRPPLAVRGLYLAAPKPDEIPIAVSFIREALPKERVNVLVIGIRLPVFLRQPP